jgi:hypothetical protein
MDNVIAQAFAQWGTFGILVIFAIYIVIDRFTNIFKSKNKDEKSSTGQNHTEHHETFGELMATMITGLSDKMDRIDDKVDRLEINSNNINNRLTTVETKINSQPQAFINQISKAQKEKEEAHNKMMEDQMKLGPELHRILAAYKDKMNAHHIFLGSFHNGTTNISGIPYCKFDLIAERFSPDEVERDIEYAFIYKDADILRHDKLPITVLNEGMVHYTINPDGTSKLSDIDDVIYRRMVGRDIKQLAVHITRDGAGKPSGFVGCTRYDYNEINLHELQACARELEIIYKNSNNK